MATLVSRATGNLMDVTTWHRIEAGAGSSQTTISASTDTTLLYVKSAQFTITNLINQIGVVMHCTRKTSTGTVTIGLSFDNGATYTREVTVNATDLPASPSWVMFLFGSAVAGDGGADNVVSIKGSSAGNATFYRDATAGNWARILVTDTDAAAVAAADVLYIVGDLTGAGASDTITVTMNDTANTDFGAPTIGDHGILSFGVAAGTAYTWKVSGDHICWANGQVNLPSDLPSDSSLDWTMDCTSNVQYGIIFKDGSSSTIHGNPITDRAFLAADAVVNDTSLTTDISTGWKSGHLVAVASTTRTYTQSEQGDLNGDAVGTALTVHGFGGVGGGLAYAHSGTAPTRAEIINLSRNVKIHGASAAFQSYILVNTTAVVSWDAVELSWMGSVTALKRGLDILTTTGSFSITNSSMHHWVVAGSMILIGGAASNNYILSNNVTYSFPSVHFQNVATTGTSWTLDGNLFMLTGPGTFNMIDLGDCGGTFTNNTVVSSAYHGITMNGCNDLIGTFSGNTVHSVGYYGLNMVNANSTNNRGSIISTITIWRCTQSGLIFNSSTEFDGFVIDGITAFGNGTNNIQVNQGPLQNSIIKNCTLNGDSTFATTYGINFSYNAGYLGNRIENCAIGVAGGIKTTHTGGDIYIASSAPIRLIGDVVTLGSATPIANLALASAVAWVGINRYGGTANDHRFFTRSGSTTTDTTIFQVTPAERLNPETTGLEKYKSSYKLIGLNNGDTVTISVKVYKSTAGDGEAYGGAQPRLIVEAAPGIGINADTVLDTMTVGLGSWETLTGNITAAGDNRVVKVYVDCDGTTGFVTVDSWSAMGEKDQSGQGYWISGQSGPGVTPTGTGFSAGSSSVVVH